jgi:5S rRNA maturation endonuclease (ribonuclease M5)/KaiC/GvpD/RAD55 family RecA-like ATPase
MPYEEPMPVEESQALVYVKSKGWPHKLCSNDSQILTDCPLCGKEQHFYVSTDPKVNANHPENQPDYLFDCKVCGRSGTLKSLKKELGDATIPGVEIRSMLDAVPRETLPLPPLEECHQRLLNDAEAFRYVTERGFSLDVIKRMKLGLLLGVNNEARRWLVYPYINAGNYQYAKMRALHRLETRPDGSKEPRFLGSKGRENPIYHADVIHSDTTELILVEGEADCISLMSLGYDNVLGVPGANMKKATWIDRLDVWWDQRALAPDPHRQIYILYDSDKAGQDAAAEIIKRIGIEKCLLIKLPAFKRKDGQDGKDLGEWIQAGHTAEDFAQLKSEAKPLEVPGVSDMFTALDEIDAEIDKRGTSDAPIDTPWKSLDIVLGGNEYGDVCGVIAEGKVGKTTFCMNWFDYLTVKLNQPGLFLCFEMPPRRIARKWVCHVTQTDDTPGRSQYTKETTEKAREVLRQRTADLLLGKTNPQDTEKVFDLIRQAVRRYGIKFMVLDNLQLMCKSIQHQAQEISNLSARIKATAMELGLFIVLVIQPRRPEANEIVASRHASGSAAIEKNVDAMICLHRNRVGVIKANEFEGFVEEEQNFGPYMLARVDLSRYSPGGATTLFMEGGTSTVREVKPEEMRQRDSVPSIGSAVPVEPQVQDKSI